MLDAWGEILPFTEEQNVERELIRNVLYGSVENILLFKHLLPPASAYAVIQSSASCGPPQNWTPSQDVLNYLFVRWRLITLTPKDYTIVEQIDPMFYMQLLSQLPLNWAKMLYQYFNSFDNSPIPERIAEDLAFGLVIMHNQFYGLYKALNPFVESLILRIGSRVLFEKLKLEALSLSKKIDPEMLQYFRADRISPEDFQNLWIIPTIWKDEKMCLIFQSLFQCAEPYPRPSNLFQSDNLITLCNHVIVKKRKQFIDEIVDPCYNILIQADDYGALDNYISFFPELRSMLVLMFYESLCANQTTLVEVVEECVKTKCGIPIFDDIINRFHNDNELFVILRQITGVSIPRKDFADVSLPYFLRNFLTTINMDDLLPLRQKEYFSINDTDRLYDFSFIFAQKCLSLAIEDIFHGEPTCKFMQYLSLVMTEEVMQILLVDLFSLIFIQRDGKFICNPLVAKTIVDAVLSLRDDQAFKVAHSKLDTAIILGTDTIDICFHENQYLLQLLFDEKKYDEAVKVFKHIPVYDQIAHTADVVNRMINHQPADFRNVKDKNLVSTEFFFVTNEGLPDIDDLDPFIKILVERRRNTTDFLTIIDADSINAVLSIVEDKEIKNLSRYPLLGDFIEFERIASHFDTNGHSIIDLITDIIEKDDVEKFEEFQKLAGQKSLELMIRRGADLGPNFKKLIQKKYPLVYSLLDGNLSLSEDTVLMKSKVIKNYLKVPDYSDWEEITASQMHDSVIKAFERKDVDHLNDLYYQDTDKYMEEIILLIKKWTLQEISQVLPFSTYKTMHLVEDKKYTIPETFINLLKNKQYYPAKVLSEEFFIHDVQNLINEHVSGYDYNEALVFKQYFPDCEIHIPKKRAEDDENLVDFVSETSHNDFKDYKQIINIIWKFSKRKSIFSVDFVDAVIECAESVISMMMVKDNKSELERIKEYSKLYSSVLRINKNAEAVDESAKFEPVLIKLNILNRLLHRHINHRFGFTYNFSNFMTSEFGLYIFTICIMYDYPNLAFDIVNAYQISSNLVHNRAFSCFMLGNYKEGVEELKRSIISTNMRSQNVQELLYNLKRTTINRLPINIDECLKFKHFISVRGTIAQSYASQVGLIASSPQIQSLDESLDIAGCRSDRIAFHASIGSFDEAFKAFFEGDYGANNFVSLIITQALANNNWNMLWRSINRAKEQYPDLMPFVMEALDFAKNLRMHNFVFDIAFRLGIHDDCLTAGIGRFTSAQSWKEQTRVLEDLKKETYKAIKEENTTRFTPEKLFELLHRIELQTQIIQLFEDDQKPFSPDLECITSRVHTLVLGANLLLDFQIGFVSEICAFDDVCLNDVTLMLVDVLPTSGRMEEFIKGMKKLNDMDARSVLPDVICAFHKRSVTLSSFMQFVNANVTSHEVRALAFAKCGMQDEALAECKLCKSQNITAEVNRILEVI